MVLNAIWKKTVFLMWMNWLVLHGGKESKRKSHRRKESESKRRNMEKDIGREKTQGYLGVLDGWAIGTGYTWRAGSICYSGCRCIADPQQIWRTADCCLLHFIIYHNALYQCGNSDRHCLDWTWSRNFFPVYTDRPEKILCRDTCESDRMKMKKSNCVQRVYCNMMKEL